MRTDCHHYFSNSVVRRVVYAKPELPSIEPVSEKANTLDEALQSAQKMLDGAKKKLRDVDSHYNNKQNIPPPVKNAYDKLNIVCHELERFISSSEKNKVALENKVKNVKTEIEIIEGTIKNIGSITGQE